MIYGMQQDDIWDATRWYMGCNKMIYGMQQDDIWDATRWYMGWITHVKNILNNIIHVLIKTYKQVSDNEEITFMSIS